MALGQAQRGQRTTLVDSPGVQLERLIAALAPREVVRGAPAEIRDLVYDTRRATPGSLFFCVSGEHADGHVFGPAAAASGATAVVVDRWLEVTCAQVLVPSVRLAMGPLSAAFFGRPSDQLTVTSGAGELVTAEWDALFSQPNWLTGCCLAGGVCGSCPATTDGGMSMDTPAPDPPAGDGPASDAP